MKIALNSGFLTDNSRDCDQSGAIFVKTASNEKYAQNIANSVATISPAKAIKMLNLKNPPKLVAITGTNGKTTTAFAIYETLLKLGFNAAISGTSGAFINGKRVASKGLTTAQFLETLDLINKASQQKCEFFIMEASSHAIAQNRIEGLDFALKIFTNLSQDHLDFHGSFENYAAVKSQFLADESVKLINASDPHIKFNAKNALFYDVNGDADFSALASSFAPNINAKIAFKDEVAELKSLLVGQFNLYNLLAAAGAVKLLTGLALSEILRALGEFKGAVGRMQKISDNPLIIIDFAHTPDGVEKVLGALSASPVIAVFGAGGDRDSLKRPIMGAIAAKLSKIAIITSDNPRSEDPNKIISQIAAGIAAKDKNRIKIEPDRKEAIRLAINLASGLNGAIIAILGKGDEDYQEIMGVKYPFSDELVATEILKELKCK